MSTSHAATPDANSARPSDTKFTQADLTKSKMKNATPKITKMRATTNMTNSSTNNITWVDELEAKNGARWDEEYNASVPNKVITTRFFVRCPHCLEKISAECWARLDGDHWFAACKHCYEQSLGKTGYYHATSRVEFLGMVKGL